MCWFLMERNRSPIWAECAVARQWSINLTMRGWAIVLRETGFDPASFALIT